MSRMMSKGIPERPELDALLKQSIELYENMTPLEKARMNWDQRISFVYGQMMDCAPHITREEIIAICEQEYGKRP